jgi:hypothetical protein
MGSSGVARHRRITVAPRPRAASAGLSAHVPLAGPKLRIGPSLSSSSSARRATSPPDAVEHEAQVGGARPTPRLPNEARHGASKEVAALRERKLSQPQS